MLKDGSPTVTLPNPHDGEISVGPISKTLPDSRISGDDFRGPNAEMGFRHRYRSAISGRYVSGESLVFEFGFLASEKRILIGFA